MLKGIPSILPPELLKILMEMGHGDELVIGDGNFPAAALGQRLVRCDGHGVPEVLDAVLTLMPLDFVVEAPVTLMHSTMGTPDPPVWESTGASCPCASRSTKGSPRWSAMNSMRGRSAPTPSSRRARPP